MGDCHREKYSPSHFKSAFVINFQLREGFKLKMRQLSQLRNFQFNPFQNWFQKQFWNEKVHIYLLNFICGVFWTSNQNVPTSVVLDGNFTGYIKYQADRLRNPCATRLVDINIHWRTQKSPHARVGGRREMGVYEGGGGQWEAWEIKMWSLGQWGASK